MSRRSRPSLDEKVRAVLTSASLFRDDTDDDDEEHVLEDVLRAFADQSNLLLQTELLRSALTSDPFEHFINDETQKTTMERLKRLAQVVDHHRVATKTGYSSIQATVRLPADSTMRPTVQTHVQLSFRYERTADGDNTTVWYSIDLSKDHGPSERMLWVHVWALGNTPAPGRARNVESNNDDEEDDLWSDMEEDETSTAQIMNNANGDVRKNGCTATPTTTATNTQDDDDDGGGEDTEEPCDRFVAGIDPDLLTQFLQWTRLGPLDDLTAFFLLMTFPFYEHEWDIVGLLLDAVFGMDGEDDDDGMDSATE